MTIPMISFFVIFLFFPFNCKNVEQNEISLILALAFFLINLIVFYFYNVIAKERILQKEKNLLVRATRDSLKKAENTVLAIEEKNKLLHDYRKHLILIQTFLNNNQWNEGLAYVESITKKTEENQCPDYTQHFLIDALIESFLKPQKNLIVKGTLPKNINMDPIDIACLFGNALENVKEACKSPTDYVEIIFSYHHSVLECTIKNTYVEDHDFFSRGLGISIMQDIIEKYEGEMEIKKENKQFNLYFHIPL